MPKFELEILSDWLSVETSSLKCWQKISATYYVKKTFLEGYSIMNKFNFDVNDRIYVKTLHNRIKLVIKIFTLQKCPGNFVS